jgi:hypothetical protein
VPLPETQTAAARAAATCFYLPMDLVLRPNQAAAGDNSKLWQMSTAAPHTPRLGCSHARHGIYSPNWMTYTHMYTGADEIGGLLRKHRLWYCSCTAGTCASARVISSVLSPDKCQASQGPGQRALASWCTDELDLERDWACCSCWQHPPQYS